MLTVMFYDYARQRNDFECESIFIDKEKAIFVGFHASAIPNTGKQSETGWMFEMNTDIEFEVVPTEDDSSMEALVTGKDGVTDGWERLTEVHWNFGSRDYWSSQCVAFESDIARFGGTRAIEALQCIIIKLTDVPPPRPASSHGCYRYSR